MQTKNRSGSDAAHPPRQREAHSSASRLHPTMSRFIGSGLLLTSMLAPLAAQAASFDCRLAKSYSEKTVCHDTHLSALDDQLAATYTKALTLAADKKALSAQRDQQWQWRQRHCHDQQCVVTWYERRLAELAADAGTTEATDDLSSNVSPNAPKPVAAGSKPSIRNEQAQHPLIIDPRLPGSGALTLSKATALSYPVVPVAAATPYTGLPLLRGASPATAFDALQHPERPKIGLFIDF